MVIRPILKRDSVKSINAFLQILSIKRRTAIAIASTTMTFIVNRHIIIKGKEKNYSTRL